MCMTRVNITVPDEVVAQAKAAGLNVSRLVTAALVDERDRRRKIDALEAYLAHLAGELGPIPADESVAAFAGANGLLTAPAFGAGRRRRSPSA